MPYMYIGTTNDLYVFVQTCPGCDSRYGFSPSLDKGKRYYCGCGESFVVGNEPKPEQDFTARFQSARDRSSQ